MAFDRLFLLRLHEGRCELTPGIGMMRCQHVEALSLDVRRQPHLAKNSYGKRLFAIIAAAYIKCKQAWLGLPALPANSACCTF